MQEQTFYDKLKLKMDEFVRLVYRLTKKFPKDELYGVVSQARRASLSIILNYIEGYARKKNLVVINFFEISYGSLKECKYLLYFALKESYINEKEYSQALILADEIGAMLWRTLEKLRK